MFECLICMKEVCDHPMDVCEECYPAYKECMEESNKNEEQVTFQGN